MAPLPDLKPSLDDVQLHRAAMRDDAACSQALAALAVEALRPTQDQVESEVVRMWLAAV